MKAIIAAIIVLSVGCAGDAGTLFQDDDIGSGEQEISGKGSQTYTYGYRGSFSSSANLRLCKQSQAEGVECIIPGRSTIRWTMQGLDECSPVTQPHVSWTYQIRRGMTGSVPGSLSGAGYGNSFTVIEDANAPSVIFKRGACPGSTTDTKMGSFVCVESYGTPITTLSESLPGSYKRVDGTLQVRIDVDRIRARVAGGQTSCSSQSDYWEDLHELIEHAAHIAVLLPFGGGMYPVASFNGANNFPSWDSPIVQPNAQNEISAYSAGGYTDGILCRIGNFVLSQPYGTLSLSSGCSD